MSGQHHREPEPYPAIRTKAIESLLIEKGLFTGDAIDEKVQAYEKDIGPLNGAKVVARAWVDSSYTLKAFDEAVVADPNDLRPRILTGSLFLEKFDSSQAATELAAVLQLNPQHPDALLAMGLRMQFDGGQGAISMVESALQTNPNLVGARVFLARQMLSAERFDEAIEEIEPALDTNPAALEALAVLATAHYLRGDTAGFEETRGRAWR